MQCHGVTPRVVGILPHTQLEVPHPTDNMLQHGSFSHPKYGGAPFDKNSGPRAMYWGQPRGDMDRYDRGADHGERSYPPRQYQGGTRSDRGKPPMYDNSHPKAKVPPPDYDDGDTKDKETFSNLITDFVGNTTLQGLPNIFRSNRLVPKLFWSSIFVVAFAATVLQIYWVFIKYYAYETTTQVFIGYDNLDFPSISVCNLNPVRRERMLTLANDSREVDRLKRFFDQFRPPKEYNKPRPPSPPTPPPTTTGGGSVRKKRNADDDFGLYGDHKPPPFNGFDKTGADWNYTSNRYAGHGDDDMRRRRQERENAVYGAGEEDPHIRIRHEFQTTVSSIPRKLRASLGHSLKNMMLDCVFNGKLCQARNFTGFLDINYGNCYTFNSAQLRNNSLRVLSSGVDAGLNLLVYVESRQHLSGVSEGRGLRLDIHPFKTMPFLWKNGLSVPVGSQTYIGLAMTNLSRLGAPYHACYEEDHFIKDYELRYTKETCINTCHDRLIAGDCNCYRQEVKHLYAKSFIEGASNPQPCASDKELECVYNIMSQRDAVLPRCACLDACREVQYDIQTSSSVWPDVALWFPMVDAVCQLDNDSCTELHDVPPDRREAFLRENFLYLRIFYRDLTFQTIEEEAEYDQSAFLSDLGGTAGLYLGASVLTFMELFDLIITCCAHGCCRRRHKRRPHSPAATSQHKDKQLRHGWSFRRSEGGGYTGNGAEGDRYRDGTRDRRSDDSFRSDFELDAEPPDRLDPGMRRPLPDKWVRR